MVVYLYASNWHIQLQHIRTELRRSHPIFLLMASASGLSRRIVRSINIVITPKKARPRQMMLDGILINLDRAPIVPKSSIVKMSCSLALFLLSISLLFISSAIVWLW
jgi:hypothetical protein